VTAAGQRRAARRARTIRPSRTSHPADSKRSWPIFPWRPVFHRIAGGIGRNRKIFRGYYARSDRDRGLPAVAVASHGTHMT
jgi:hypothetical protein